jgi:glycosyltransferase involved in cell wall biosynthesis
VLHVAQPTDGGVGRYLLDVGTDQLARGWSVCLASPAGPVADQLQERGASVWTWPATRSPGPATILETLALRRIIEHSSPDVVHLHSSKAGLAGRLAIRGRRPTIFQPHGWSWLAVTGTVRRFSTLWERHGVRWADVCVCVGHDELAAGRLAGVPAPMTVVRNGVDRARFTPADEAEKRCARRVLGLSETGPLVVCAGRVSRQKGQDVLLTAWPAVRERCPRARLVIVGDGDLLPALRRYAGPGVQFVRPTTDIRPWLVAADVVAVPSRWEGLPLIALEAAATGRAIVGTTVGGLGEVVTPGVGYLVPPDDPAALADALARRLDEPALAAAEGRQASQVAVRFDQRRTLDDLARLTVAVVQARHPRRDFAVSPSAAIVGDRTGV